MTREINRGRRNREELAALHLHVDLEDQDALETLAQERVNASGGFDNQPFAMLEASEAKAPHGLSLANPVEDL
jgi:hypothetical protein